MFLVHHADHLFPLYPQRGAGGNGAGRGHMLSPPHRCQRLFSYELPGGQKRDGGLLPLMRNDGQFCAARPKIEDGVSRASLRKENLLGLQLDDSSSHSCCCQKGGEIEGHASHLGQLNGPSQMRSTREQFGSASDRFRFEVAGILSSPAQLCKMIYLSARTNGQFCRESFPPLNSAGLGRSEE